MAFNQGMLEEIVDWCRDIPELAVTRREALSHFFGDEDERPVEYWPGTGERCGVPKLHPARSPSCGQPFVFMV